MSNTTAPTRVEPKLEGTSAASDSPAAAEFRAAAEPRAPDPRPAETRSADAAPRLDRAGLDQLSRIEEKTARVEEKYARTEALMHRLESKLEHTTNRAAEMARQADLVAVRAELDALARRVRRLPGLSSLVFVALVSILLTVAGTVALLRYGVPGVPSVPAVLPR